MDSVEIKMNIFDNNFLAKLNLECVSSFIKYIVYTRDLTPITYDQVLKDLKIDGSRLKHSTSSDALLHTNKNNFKSNLEGIFNGINTIIQYFDSVYYKTISNNCSESNILEANIENNLNYTFPESVCNNDIAGLSKMCFTNRDLKTKRNIDEDCKFCGVKCYKFMIIIGPSLINTKESYTLYLCNCCAYNSNNTLCNKDIKLNNHNKKYNDDHEIDSFNSDTNYNKDNLLKTKIMIGSKDITFKNKFSTNGITEKSNDSRKNIDYKNSSNANLITGDCELINKSNCRPNLGCNNCNKSDCSVDDNKNPELRYFNHNINIIVNSSCNDDENNRCSCIYNYTKKCKCNIMNQNNLSSKNDFWNGFKLNILDKNSENKIINPISSKMFPSIECKPKNSSFDCNKEEFLTKESYSNDIFMKVANEEITDDGMFKEIAKVLRHFMIPIVQWEGIYKQPCLGKSLNNKAFVFVQMEKGFQNDNKEIKIIPKPDLSLSKNCRNFSYNFKFNYLKKLSEKAKELGLTKETISFDLSGFELLNDSLNSENEFNSCNDMLMCSDLRHNLCTINDCGMGYSDSRKNCVNDNEFNNVSVKEKTHLNGCDNICIEKYKKTNKPNDKIWYMIGEKLDSFVEKGIKRPNIF